MGVKPPGAHLSIRIDFGPGQRLGPGKIRLLEEIEKHGSISAGGRALDMSYKRAWELVHAMNEMFGAAVVSAKTGGSKGGGATLTPLGAKILTSYHAIEAKALSATHPDLNKLLKFKVLTSRG
jgi:molybdate transport system regulatory protein